MRVKYQDVFVDGNGRVVSGGTVTVYVAETSTLKSIYTTETGATPITGSVVTSASDGSFSFWVSNDYPGIKLVMNKTNYVTATYDNILPGGGGGSSPNDVWVDDYGAVGDGVTDDSVAVQAAIDSIGTEGGTVRFTCNKNYLLNISIKTSNITMQHCWGGSGPLNTDTGFLAPYDVSKPVITLTNDSAYAYVVHNFILRNALIKGQKELTAPWPTFEQRGQKGIFIEKGRYYTTLDEVAVVWFTEYQIRIGPPPDDHPISHTTIRNSTIQSTTIGIGDCIQANYGNLDIYPSSFVTGTTIENTSMTTGPDYPPRFQPWNIATAYAIDDVVTSEALSVEKSTGTLTIGTYYVITATETDHFGTDYIIGTYFTAIAETACDANNKVKEVTHLDEPPNDDTKWGYVFRCTTAGTSGAVRPTWNYTLGGSTTDGGVIWKTYQRGRCLNLVGGDITLINSGCECPHYGGIKAEPCTGGTTFCLTLNVIGSSLSSEGRSDSVVLENYCTEAPSNYKADNIKGFWKFWLGSVKRLGRPKYDPGLGVGYIGTRTNSINMLTSWKPDFIDSFTLTAQSDAATAATKKATFSIDSNGYLTISSDKVTLSPSTLPVYDGDWDGDHLIMGGVHVWEDQSSGITGPILRYKFGVPTSETDGAILPNMFASEWDSVGLMLSGYRLWVDALGKLRIKFGQPSSDLDGTIVGTQA